MSTENCLHDIRVEEFIVRIRPAADPNDNSGELENQINIVEYEGDDVISKAFLKFIDEPRQNQCGPLPITLYFHTRQFDRVLGLLTNPDLTAFVSCDSATMTSKIEFRSKQPDSC